MDENKKNNSGNTPSQRDKENRSRARRYARNIAKGALIGAAVTNPIAGGIGYAAYKGAQKLRQNSPSEEGSSTPDAPTQEPVPDAFQKAFENDPPEATDPTINSREKPTTRLSQLKSSGKKALKGTGKVYMYTSPGAFIVGKYGPRIYERMRGKKRIEEIENEAKSQESEADKTPPPPKKPSKTNYFAKNITKKGAGLALKGLWYTSIPGLAHLAGKILLPKQTKRFESQLKTRLPKKEPEKKTQTAFDYLSAWNEATLKKTLTQRQKISAKIAKLFQSKAWKYGKYVLAPTIAAPYDAVKFYKQRHNALEGAKSYVNFYNSNEQGKKDDESKSATSPQQPVSGKSESLSSRIRSFMGRQDEASPEQPKVSRLSNINRRLGKRFGNGAAKSTAKNAAKRVTGKAASKIGQKLAQQAVLTFLKTPPGWVTLAVIGAVLLGFGFIMLIAIIISGGGGSGGGGIGGGTPGGGAPPGANENPIPGFSLTKSASATQLPEPAEITYTISFSNSGATPLDTITVYDQIPQNTTLVAGKTSGDYVVNGGIISWTLSSSENTSPLSFTVIPTSTDIVVTNTAYATADRSLPSDGSDLPATTDNCNGAYTLNNPLGNFGDPDCYVAQNQAQAKSDMYDMLTTLDPANADGWYLKVIPCESGYNPNAYADHEEVGTPDAAGAWGLMQMGRGLNGEYDHGDVPWERQISNAVNYGKMLTRNGIPLGAYWWCWR